jgi:type IV fimbrial biogenesis protein FimT
MMKWCSRKGFTLIELIIALVIIGILVTLSVPTFNSFIQSYRISANSDQLYYYLQYARSEAIKRNANVYVSFNTGDTWCYGINTGSACDCTTASNCNLGAVSYAAAGQQTLSTSGMSGNSIYFEGSHSAASASSSVTFTQYGQSAPLITISIGRLGNLSTCSTGISGYTAC